MAGKDLPSATAVSHVSINGNPRQINGWGPLDQSPSQEWVQVHAGKCKGLLTQTAERNQTSLTLGKAKLKKPTGRHETSTLLWLKQVMCKSSHSQNRACRTSHLVHRKVCLNSSFNSEVALY